MKFRSEDGVSVILKDTPRPKVSCRPKGNGCNLRLIAKLLEGGCVWGVSFKKARSLFETGRKRGIRLSIRMLPDNDGYGVWKA
jgi:hypothetical protein